MKMRISIVLAPVVVEVVVVQPVTLPKEMRLQIP
jgi:hypothetical protein